MNHETPDGHEQELLLARITKELREYPVPDLPEDLQGWTPMPAEAPRRASWKMGWKTVALAGLAASLLIGCGVGWWKRFGTPTEPPIADARDTSDKPHNTADERHNTGGEPHQEFEVMEIHLAAGLQNMTSGLDQLDREIDELKQRAKLIDARRKTQQLILEMAQSAGSSINEKNRS